MLLQPIDDKLKVVEKCQLTGIKLSFFCNQRQFSPKPAIFFPDHRTTRNCSLARSGLKPVANMANRIRRTSVVCFDILAADIGNKAFISIWGSIQN